MARFVFKLEPLLKHRRAIEDDRQRRLARLLRQKLAIESQLRFDQQTIMEDKRQMVGALVGYVNVVRIRQHAAHQHQAAVRAQQAAWKLLELTRQIELARRELVEAMKKRKAVELLRDRRFDRWRREQDHRATAELDELATQRYTRWLQEVAA